MENQIENQKKVLMIIAPTDFRDEEYFEPKNIFESNGFIVDTASNGVNQAKGKLGGIANINIDIDEVEVDNYDVIVFVGGSGANQYKGNDDIGIILDDIDEGQLLCAICIAPTILAYFGKLKGVKATVWNGDGQQGKYLEDMGAIYTGADVQIDKNIVTADGPDSARKFAQTIVKLLIN